MSYDTSWPPTREQGAGISPQRASSSRASQGPGKFPQKWHLYQPGWTRKFKIGEHQDAPLFAVIPHSGWFGRPRLTLHTGAGRKSDVLAVVKKSSFSLRNRAGFTIVFPSAEAREDDDVVEVMAHLSPNAMFQHRSYQFTVRAGTGWERHTETFEWRYTHGKNIGILREGRDDGKSRKAMSRLQGGWELVRLGSERFRPGQSGWSGGEEIVAVFGEASMSMHKKASFAFLGSGATGKLGERFANMAVITGMALWDEEQRQRRQRQANSATLTPGIDSRVM